MYSKRSGFTLVEVLVVLSIIAVLSAVVYANFAEGRAQGRDAKRQSDLRNLQTAIELYRQDNGRYPERCPTTGSSWSGQVGTSYECTDGSGMYILDLAPKYIRSLPSDSRLQGANSGYVYAVNSEGTVYKIMAKNTVESETVGFSHELKSCDVTNNNRGICDATHPSNNRPGHCQSSSDQFQSSYGLWGGYADEVSDNFVERRTEDIVCDIQ